MLKDLIGENDFSYPKSLYAVMDIVKIMSGDGDIVLDFFGGSGTTAHAVWQANAEQNIKRRFIICEQLEDHIRIMQQRLLAVLKQEKMQNNSFVSCELAKFNQNYVEEIEAAQDGDELGRILERMLETGFVSYKADLAALRKSPQEFETLPVNDKKRLLMDLLDKNQLYINYCDIDDEEMAVSEADKAFTRSFYGVG